MAHHRSEPGRAPQGGALPDSGEVGATRTDPRPAPSHLPPTPAGTMHVFCHHIYEYRKGLRKLILFTTRQANEANVRDKLSRNEISHVIHDIGGGKINVFLGDPACIEVVRCVGKSHLGRYTDEEDFILGAMLGYDIRGQCRRYLRRKRRARAPAT